MQGKVNYAVVGIFVVVLTAFLFVAIFWMTTFSGNKKYNTYLVYVHEDVTGLSAESPVRFNGVKVGYVEAVNLDAANPKLVRLKLGIEPGIPITTSTYAILNAQGVTGVIYVNLKAETETAPKLVALPGQPYPVIPSRPSLLMQLSAVLPQVSKEIQKLTASIAQVLDKQNQESISTSLKNIASISQMLVDNSTDFTETMKSLDNTMANMSEASNTLPETIKSLNATLSSVHRFTKTADSTMQSGKMAINNFSDQVIPSAQQALSNLSQATESMNNLAEELQRNPSILVRGKQPNLPGPGEK